MIKEENFRYLTFELGSPLFGSINSDQAMTPTSELVML
jgi:hypothetical protein